MQQWLHTSAACHGQQQQQEQLPGQQHDRTMQQALRTSAACQGRYDGWLAGQQCVNDCLSPHLQGHCLCADLGRRVRMQVSCCRARVFHPVLHLVHQLCSQAGTVEYGMQRCQPQPQQTQQSRCAFNADKYCSAHPVPQPSAHIRAKDTHSAAKTAAARNTHDTQYYMLPHPPLVRL